VQQAQIVPSSRFAAAAQVVDRAIGERSFPAAVVEVGDATRPLWRQALEPVA